LRRAVQAEDFHDDTMMNILTGQLFRVVFALPLVSCAAALAQAPAENAVIDVVPSVVETNPAVRAALELPSETPADHFQAIVWLLDLGRPQLAQPILESLTKLQLNDAQRAALVSEFGSRDMLLLARAKELAPAGAEFANACMAAAAAADRDQQRTAALVAQLTDPSAEVRELARNDLAATGRHGVLATLEALAQETNRDRRTMLLAAAAQMRPLVIGPLLAMLDSNDAALRADVADLLRHLQVPQAAPLIAADPASAERALTHAIERSRQGIPPFAADELNRVEIWKWCDETKLIVARVPAEDAAIIWMSRLAQRRAEWRPDNRGYERQSLLLGLEAETLLQRAFETDGRPLCATAGSEPAVQQLRSTDAQLVNAVLADALQAKYAHASVAAAAELGRRRQPHVLYSADAQPSPLANALLNGNRRVRYAALEAIMSLDPPSPYPGSSRVPEALTWFAASAGERQVLVAMPTLAASTNMAGMLAAHELYGQATNRGRDAVAMALDMADLEMIFIDMNIQAPGIREVLYELRISATTGEVPIALLAAEGRLDAAQRLAAEHQRVIAVSRPHSKEVLARVVERLIGLAGPNPVPPQRRAEQAERATQWLDKLAATRPFYTIRRAAQFERSQAHRNAARPDTAPQP
jgi:hypothetical protein